MPIDIERAKALWVFKSQIIPKLVELQKAGAHLNLLSDPEFQAIEKEYSSKTFEIERFNFSSQIFLRNMVERQERSNKAVADMLDKLSMEMECGTLLDQLPPELQLPVPKEFDISPFIIPGVAIGLAAFPMGGLSFLIEAVKMAGSGRLIFTGNGTRKIRDSAELAMTYLKTHTDDLNLSADIFKENDFHIDLRKGRYLGAGPSAGLPMIAALFSIMSGRPLRPAAMTGEVDIRGRVLAVGGIKEKVAAAYEEGIKAVILPRRNEREVKNLPKPLREVMEIILVETAAEALEFTLTQPKKEKAA